MTQLEADKQAEQAATAKKEAQQKVVDTLEQEVKTTGAANPYAVIIEEVFGLDKIEFLQSHENMEIYQKAFDIIERYFGTEEEDKEVIYYYIILVS